MIIVVMYNAIRTRAIIFLEIDPHPRFFSAHFLAGILNQFLHALHHTTGVPPVAYLIGLWFMSRVISKGTCS